MGKRGFGVIHITMKLLKEVLHIDDEVVIRHVWVDNDHRDLIKITVESDKLEWSVPEGAVLPQVTLEELRGWDE